jgi:hypothetical protein
MFCEEILPAVVTDIFVGRQAELARLSTLFKKKSASLVVVKGRRRIGKSCIYNKQMVIPIYLNN